jgi:hypothetical protein
MNLKRDLETILSPREAIEETIEARLRYHGFNEDDPGVGSHVADFIRRCADLSRDLKLGGVDFAQARAEFGSSLAEFARRRREATRERSPEEQVSDWGRSLAARLWKGMERDGLAAAMRKGEKIASIGWREVVVVAPDGTTREITRLDVRQARPVTVREDDWAEKFVTEEQIRRAEQDEARRAQAEREPSYAVNGIR